MRTEKASAVPTIFGFPPTINECRHKLHLVSTLDPWRRSGIYISVLLYFDPIFMRAPIKI